MALPDSELIIRAREGDIGAFEQLVYKHDKQVLAIAARFTSSAEDAKDIYQEVFLRVYRGLRRFQFKSEFSTWLHRITTNVCLTHHSRQKHKTHVSLDEASDSESDEGHSSLPAADADSLPDQQAMDADMAMRVREALEVLSPKQRMVFTLRHYEGYKLKEIAVMMNCMEGTVKRYLFTATSRMREQLKDFQQ